MKILIADKFGEDLPGKLAKYGEVVSEDMSQLKDADVLLVRSKTKPNKEFIDSAPNLKLIIRGGVGIDNIDTAYCKEKGILVHNTPSASAIAVAELVIAQMLTIQRRIVEAHNSTNAGRWEKKKLKGAEIYQKTLGLIGIGRIATEVAVRAKAFGMDIISYDPYVKEHEIARMTTLEEVLKGSDFISLHIPFTEETADLINKETLSLMKDNAVILNTSRGKVINEDDLAAALKAGTIRYAAIDVYRKEPPEGSPLIGLDNILVTPHLGASTGENLQRIGQLVEKLVGELSRGELS
jgi:D-3-phosphoglycerate dehydrogenase